MPSGPPSAAMIDFETVFCDVDDFCQEFLPDWHRQLLTQGERRRQRASRLTLSEILMILIVFHQSQYRTFKAFYLLHLSRYARAEFPHWLRGCRQNQTVVVNRRSRMRASASQTQVSETAGRRS
ncbi:hypothetical protein Thivi_2934 [Thiocystis violascens DSM 198]|uniref:Transposase n=1 Tax=Thiocystis violascens (strain ATCC 17096 / DSM 198 / 6111) TaxID=765911 RepID=I3YCW6_THIV6|nr:hypothetical protein Thivi_2934 [Thiocystis violascens DSM 198]